MLEDINRFDSKEAFKVICDTFDAEEFSYEKDEENMVVMCMAQGEDIPMELMIRVDDKRAMVSAISHMPFKIKEEKRMDMAIAICKINNDLINGLFEMKLSEGDVYFKMNNTLIGCSLTPEIVRYMIYTTFNTVDEYNDKFLMLNKGILSLEKLLEKDN